MQLPTNINNHYLDYYNEWCLALLRARQLTDMKEVYIKGQAFIGLINERKDAGIMTPELCSEYATEVNQKTYRKHIVFLN